MCFAKEKSIEFLQKQSVSAIGSFDDLKAEQVYLKDIEKFEANTNNLLSNVEIHTEEEFECYPNSKKTEKPKKNVMKKHDCGKDSETIICDQCGNNFTCKQHFLIHLRRHTGDKRYQCQVCSNKFFTHSELNRHIRRHTGEKPFPCKHCSRRFSHVTTRIKHERIHTNERPFICTQCSKSFTTSNNLRNHMLVHTGERSFWCELCNKAFQRQTHLVVHYKSIMHRQNIDKQQ